MTKARMTIGELAGKILGEGNSDMLRQIIEQMLAAIMDVEDFAARLKVLPCLR